MKKVFWIILLIATLPFSGCKKEDVANDMNVADYQFDHLQLSLNTYLSNEEGQIVEMANHDGQTRLESSIKVLTHF